MTLAAPVETQIRTDVQSITATSRQSRLMIWLQGCGAGILLMLQLAWVHISPVHEDLYHRLLPMNTVYGGVAIDLVIVCLFCTGAFWLLERFDPDGHTLWWVLIAAILLIEVYRIILLVGVWLADVVGILFLIVSCLAAFCALWLWNRPWYSKIVWSLRGGLAMLGVCIAWMLPQLVYMAAHPEPHEVWKFVRAAPPARVPQRRVVWILFDELSQDQVFDHRQPGISLPQLDQFRNQAVMFSDMKPAGYMTEDVVPSLLWGKVVSGIRSDLAGNLSVRTSNRWQRFSPEQTLFADAQREGWSTGTAGWYNPYCRTYGASLDWCAWTSRYGILGNYSPDKSLWWNVKAPLIRPETQFSPYTPKMHAADYSDLMQWSHELIDDENIGFVFLHLPLPHPFGFYNRKTSQIGVPEDYLDNLVLTDHSLGLLMQWIGQTPLASRTTVIVCSDHSWRVSKWRADPGWSREEERATGGKFDTRPVLMVHFPGEKTPEVVSKPFPALKEHDLIESLLHRPMTANDLKDWAQR